MLADLRLRNRVIKTATFEGMSPGGVPSAKLVEHHAAIARGGVGMTTLAYCSVAPEGRTFADQLVMSEALVDQLRPLTDAVHAEGAAASIQLGHCGGFSKDLAQRRHSPPGPLGPSRAIGPGGLWRRWARSLEKPPQWPSWIAAAAPASWTASVSGRS